jgi:glycosyltransferase involved in cell wall biosynthesis
MKIAVIAPVWFPVPPTGYGGTEWIVSLLADGLADAGEDVTLFASGDSMTKAKLAYVYAEAPSHRIGHSLPEVHHALACYELADEFDVIHEHSGPPGAALGGAVSTPVVHTLHGPLDGEAGPIYEQIARVAPQVGFISISYNQRKPKPDLPWVANVPNALELSMYPCKPHRGDYLLFLGRMSPDKGAHRAIAVAMETGIPLKIAGKRRETKEREYFEELIRPHLGNGIEYLGEVSHGEKVELLQNARVTLFPIEWEEPFGLVMIESMACGTPVIATRWGAVPEVIEEDSRGGIVVDDYRQMAGKIEEADEMDPYECRAYVEERFSRKRMVEDYMDAYRAAIARAG